MFRCISTFLLVLGALVVGSQGADDPLMKKLEEFKYKNRDSLAFYAQKIVRESDETAWRSKGAAYQALGIVQFEKFSNYDSALALYDLAATYLNQAKDSTLLAFLYNSYGVVMKFRSDYEQALTHFYRALDFVSPNKNSNLPVTIYNNIGEVTFSMRKVDEAEEYHQLAYELALQQKDSFLLGNTLLYLGNLASSRQQFPKAIDYYVQSNAYLSTFDTNRAPVLMNIGVVYHFQGELRKAVAYYKEAIEMARGYGSLNSMALSYLNMGEALISLNDPEALPTLNKCIEIAVPLKLQQTIATAHLMLSDYYEGMGKPALALSHYKSHKSYSDSVLNQSSQSRIAELQVQFETVQKENQIIDQQLLLEQKNASIIEQRNRNLLITGSLLVILFLGGTYFIYFRSNQKSQWQQAVILEKENGLKAVFHATEEERQRIAKDLHDGIGQQLSGVRMKLESMQSEDLQPLLKEKTQSITGNLIEASEDLRRLSHEIMPRSLTEAGLVPALDDLLDKTFSFSPIQYVFEHHSADVRFPPEVELSLYRAGQELVNNVIKHAKASRVSVQLYKMKDRLMLIVEDDGKGFDPKLKATGHGLLNVQNRLSTVNGKVSFESIEGEGSVATLSVPISQTHVR